MASRNYLMIPGPTEVDPEVLAVLSRPVLPHYGKEWGALYQEILADAQTIFRTKAETLVLPAPGAAALEMAAANLVEPGDRVVVVVNGFFAEIAESLVKIYGGQAESIVPEYGRAVEPDQVAARLDRSPRVKALFVVHNETSTGVANPIPALGRLTRQRGVLLVVDAVSSYGGMELDMDSWGMDFCVGYASKALAGVAGAVPVAVGEAAWEAVRKRKQPVPGRFLNLLVWRKFIDEWGSWGHPHPTTMPVSVILAFGKALKLALAEGLEQRYRRHQVVARAVRAGLRRMGLEVLPPEGEASATVSVFKAEGELGNRIRKTLASQFHIMIAGGLSKLEGKVLRIGHMGNTASLPHMVHTLGALAMTLKGLGYDATVLEGLPAALEVLQQEAP